MICFIRSCNLCGCLNPFGSTPVFKFKNKYFINSYQNASYLTYALLTFESNATEKSEVANAHSWEHHKIYV